MKIMAILLPGFIQYYNYNIFEFEIKVKYNCIIKSLFMSVIICSCNYTYGLYSSLQEIDVRIDMHYIISTG